MTVRCERCGETWPRDPALEVECPRCQAKVGRKCIDLRPSEHRVSFGLVVHNERDQLALDMGLIKKCAGSKPPEIVQPRLAL